MRSDIHSPLVSFVVPVFNVAPYVLRCLSSVQAQSIRKIEVLIVDDGSTDGSGSICDDVACRDNRVSVVHTPNRGVSHARNLGLGRASGEYVCFVDSDDWLSPVFTERMVALAEGAEAPVAACGPTRVDSDGTVLWRQPHRHLVLGTEDALCAALRRDLYCGWPWNKIFRRDLLRDGGVRFDETLRYCEDLIFCFDAIRLAPRVAYDSAEDLYFYRESESSVNKAATAGGRFNPKYLDRLEADAKILERANLVSPRVLRHARANAFVSNESVFRKISPSAVHDPDLLRRIAAGMARNLPAVLPCRGFGSFRTKCRYVCETARALCGKPLARKNEP